MSVIEEFRRNIGIYEHLKSAVVFTIEDALSKENLKIHSVTARVKEVKSFLDKINRKQYADPFVQTEDIVGCRVVCLFISDLERVRKMISDSFEVVERIDKVEGGPVEEFGYMSTHYVCRMHPSHTGPYYDGIRTVKFEIQCRTILMDAWANVSHHLAYKGENSIPSSLRKDFHALSGLFYVADRHFEIFSSEAQKSMDASFAAVSTGSTVDNAEIGIDLHSLTAYLATEFADREQSDAESVSEYVEELSKAGYETIGQLHQQVSRAIPAFEEYEKGDPAYSFDGLEDERGRYTSLGLARVALAIADPAFDKVKYGSTSAHQRFRALVER